MNETPIENIPLDQASEEKPTATCLGFTRQELIKMKKLVKFSLIFFMIYIFIGMYFMILSTYSVLIPGKRKKLNIRPQILIEVIMPVFFLNGIGKLLTFYSASTSSLLGMKISSFTQLMAFFLDIYFFINVVSEGQKISSGFYYDDLFLISFVYFCICFDFILILTTIVLNVQLTIYGFIERPKVNRSCIHGQTEVN